MGNAAWLLASSVESGQAQPSLTARTQVGGVNHESDEGNHESDESHESRIATTEIGPRITRILLLVYRAFPLVLE